MEGLQPTFDINGCNNNGWGNGWGALVGGAVGGAVGAGWNRNNNWNNGCCNTGGYTVGEAGDATARDSCCI